MRKIKITVAVPAEGTPTVLYLGTDAEAAMDALRAAKGTIDGEVLYIKNPLAHRRWKGSAEAAAPAPRKTARKKYSPSD